MRKGFHAIINIYLRKNMNFDKLEVFVKVENFKENCYFMVFWRNCRNCQRPVSKADLYAFYFKANELNKPAVNKRRSNHQFVLVDYTCMSNLVSFAPPKEQWRLPQSTAES